MGVGLTLNRRQALVAGAVSAAGATAGCSGASPPSGRPSPSGSAGSTPSRKPGGQQPAADRRLRDRAIADERRLLRACAAPTGAQPFASIRAMHERHLQQLTGTRPVGHIAVHGPAAAPLAAAERAAAASRREDCAKASAALAPVLASIAASAEIAAVLLQP